MFIFLYFDKLLTGREYANQCGVQDVWHRVGEGCANMFIPRYLYHVGQEMCATSVMLLLVGLHPNLGQEIRARTVFSGGQRGPK